VQLFGRSNEVLSPEFVELLVAINGAVFTKSLGRIAGRTSGPRPQQSRSQSTA
jgi:hypothetical protein